MKITNLLFLLLIIGLQSFAQDSLWKKNVFNEILTINLPAHAEFSKTSFVNIYGGGVNANYYGFQYYDTVFMLIKNDSLFHTSLSGFMSGRITDQLVRKYNVTVVDTTINATRGLMAIFTTSDNQEIYKRIYSFVTIANNQYYNFYAYSPYAKVKDEEINFFFRSIMFDNKKINERSFKLKRVNLTKKAD
jgi:hypothetical protein